MNAEERSRKGLMIFLGVILLTFLPPHSLLGKSEQNAIYRDDKNGYFFFVPPKGWTIQEYSDPRTKVAFHHPGEYDVFLRFIVKEVPGYTLSDMRKDAEHVRQTWKTKGVLFRLEETDVLGVKGISLTGEIPNLYIRIIKLIKFGIHFSIAFNSPNKAQFQKYLGEVTRSINTIVVLKPASLDLEKAKQQQIGHYLRSAELCWERGDRHAACNILREVIREYPNREDVQKMSSKFKCK